MADKTAERNFPIVVGTSFNDVVDSSAGYAYRQHIVHANNFVIAHFVDEGCRDAFIKFLGLYGFEKFPEKIKRILRAEHEKTVAAELLKIDKANGKKHGSNG